METILDISKIQLTEVEIRENGLIKLEIKKLPIPQNFIHQFIISIPPLVMGGNHKHQHQEIFFSVYENLELHWITGEGVKRSSKLREGNEIFLFIIPAGIPHAVINTSPSITATLVEFADGERNQVERVIVL